MKALQKQYELKSKLFVNNNIQKLDIIVYFKFLNQIRHRPNKYSILQEKSDNKRFIYEPFKDPNVIEANKKHKSKIYSIINEPVLPKLNNVYLEVRETIKNNKEKYREMAKRNLSVENSKFQDRLLNQKPRVEEILDFKRLNKRYSKLMKSSRTDHYDGEYRKYAGNSQDLILPSINGNKERNSEKLFQTEINTNQHSVPEKNEENSEKLKEHKHDEISHQKQGHIE